MRLYVTYCVEVREENVVIGMIAKTEMSRREFPPSSLFSMGVCGLAFDSKSRNGVEFMRLVCIIWKEREDLRVSCDFNFS